MYSPPLPMPATTSPSRNQQPIQRYKQCRETSNFQPGSALTLLPVLLLTPPYPSHHRLLPLFKLSSALEPSCIKSERTKRLLRTFYWGAEEYCTLSALVESLFCFGLWEEEPQIGSSETLVFDSERRQLGSELDNGTDQFLVSRHKENEKADAKQRSGISYLGNPQMGHFTMVIHETRIIEVKQQNSDAQCPGENR
ncbi:hypothetical protein M436DRAFT_59984 [Aureobasidium namibiae CBS 147.97]|uniref:Uncharacterized protein n=1 Tax=Aureobasidium namibiae CBS 147.97 TaxID=1043004 RepID=A0A074XTY3_9PEZI|nr:uncharacterized protein M436DRAFT_59984 [Aureobasidium namibiae CBS 147.97]KEQ78046.1 hypothetical protein M436DRAFT_59984 [Aureobasidium namibiae CBS 147.97]